MKHRILHLIAVLLMIAANTTAQTITVSDYEAGAGWNETIKVNISDASEITAVQFNLSLPEGVVLDEGWLEQRGHQVFLGNAANGHSLAVKPLTSGDLLIVVYGLNLQTFNDGTLVEIMTMATDDVTTSNGRLYNVRTATVAAESKALSDVKFTAVVGEEPEAKYYWYVGTTEPTELNGEVANAETDKWVEIGNDLSAVKYITIDTSDNPDYSFPAWYVLMPTSLGFKPHNSIGTKDESSAWDISDSSIEGYTLYVVDEGTLEAVFSTFKKEGSLPYDENADYWYLGQTDPSTRTEIYPIALQNWAIDDAWEEIVNSSEKIEVNKQPADWDFDSFTALWYVAMPASSGYTPQDADLWETSTATIAGKDYIVYKSEGKVWELNTAFLPEGYVEEEPVDPDPVYAEIENGDYYLQNVGSGKFLVGANSWGTQASLGQRGVSITLERLPNGKYTLDTHIANNDTDHYLGSNGYMDAPAAEWTIVEPAPGVYALTLDEVSYWGYDGSSVILTGTLTDATQPAAQWQLVTRTMLEEALAQAAQDNPVDATFFIKGADFNRNHTDNNAWQGGPVLGGRSEQMCAEKWNTTFDVYQDLVGLPDGYYRLSVQGFYRDGNSATENRERHAILYAGETTIPLMSILDDEDVTDIPNSMDAASDLFAAGHYTGNSVMVEVTGGALRIGIRKEVLIGSDWTIFDNFELYYLGTEVTGIESSVLKAQCSQLTYDLTGRRVTHPTKGIYIVNGRKVVVK